MLTVKIYFDNEVRRVSLEEDLKTFQDLASLIKTLVKRYNKSWQIKYYDEERDLVTIASDLELAEALKISRQISNNILRIHLYEVKKSVPKDNALVKFGETVKREVEEFFVELSKKEPLEKIQQFINSLFEKKEVEPSVAMLPPPELNCPPEMVPEMLDEVPPVSFSPPPYPSPIEGAASVPLKKIDVSLTKERPSARFLTDVTVRPGTEFRMGERFVKIWRFRNEGVAPWPVGTKFSYVRGNPFYLQESVDVPALNPMEECDIQVPMVAPNEPGRYYSSWRLYHDNLRFGPRVGCDIVVTETQPLPETPESDPSGVIQQLVDMGFTDVELIQNLLTAYSNDVSRVLGHLLSSA